MRMILWTAAFFFLTIPVKADQLRDCSRIENSVERLACFDNLAEDAAPKPSAPADDGSIGKWQRRFEVSKIDDSKNVLLYLKSSSKVTDRYGREKTIALVLGCSENRTKAYISFGGHFMTSTTVTYRLDKSPARKERFSESTDHQALFAPKAIAFIKALLEANTLVIRATPHSENPVTAEFKLDGLNNAIKPLREACHW